MAAAQQPRTCPVSGVLDLVDELVWEQLGEAVDEWGPQDDPVDRSADRWRQRRQPVSIREPGQRRCLEEEALRAEPVEGRA
jgi:hypothetical protein